MQTYLEQSCEIPVYDECDILVVGGGAAGLPAEEDFRAEAVAALVSLGYSQSEAALAVSKIDATLPVEEIIKLALRGMAAGRR